MRSEEDRGPDEVKKELSEKEQGQLVLSESSLMPDEGEAGADHGVENAPDRAEDLIGRGAGGLAESGIPGRNGTSGEEGPEAAEEFHDDDAEDDFCEEGAEHGSFKLAFLRNSAAIILGQKKSPSK